jgi:L-2-hydroxyglutarate oxidase LhgO
VPNGEDASPGGPRRRLDTTIDAVTKKRGYTEGMETVDAVVIGAGVIGLAVARRLARSGREVWIVESRSAFGTETSARNSEVIHAGLYYPPGSLKSDLCIRGKKLLYRYCADQEVTHRPIGKLLVACDDAELPRLAALAKRADAVGVPLRWLTPADVRQLEPAVRAVAGLYSPTTGIVDAHGLMRALLADAERAGAVLVTRTPVTALATSAKGIVVSTGGEAPLAVRARTVINAAGLGAQELVRRSEGFPRDRVPPAYLAKGHYFALRGRAPFRHLVYPMPDAAGLGIHVTLDLGGACRFGPDVSGWPLAPDYAFEPGLEARFYRAIRRYYPDLADGALEPAFTGIRPKVTGPADAAGDFVIQGPAAHGVPGLVNLFGIESPGLTACLAIAERVEEALGSGSRLRIV